MNQKQESDLTLLDGVLDEYASVPGSLITILQKAQEIYGYLPQDVLRHIAQQTGVKPAKVFGVATFYAQFRFQPVGKYLIMLCQGNGVSRQWLSDDRAGDRGGVGNSRRRNYLGRLFTLKDVACLGCCSLSPVMMINDETYGTLTPEKTKKILRELKARASEQKGGPQS